MPPRAETDRGDRVRPQLVALLAAGRPWSEIAAETGLSRSTVARRAADPTIRAEVNRHREALLREATGRAAALLGRAIDTLADLLADENPGIRLAAARELVGCATRLHENAELVERISELEARVKATRAAELLR